MEAVVTRAAWRTTVSDYFEMTKPKVQSLLLFTTVTTMYVAGDPSLGLVALTCLGGALSAGGAGAITHLSAELFKSMAKVDILFVPYKGNGLAMNDLIGGQVQMMFGTAGTVAPHVRSGRVRAIAVTSAEPSVLAPGLPTIAASGLPGYESISIYGIYAPAKTPETIIRQLNSAIRLRAQHVRRT